MISLLCPTRGRPTKARKMALSALETAKSPPFIRFYIDDDDPRAPDYESWVQGIKGPCVRAGLAHAVLCDMCPGGIRVMVGDDVRFRTHGWDERFEDVQKQFPDGIYVITTETGIVKMKDGERKQPCAHPAIGPGWYDALGYTCPPVFQHFMPDIWVTEVADMIGRHVHLPDVLLEHQQISRHTERTEVDETYLHIRDMKPGEKINATNRRDRMVYQRLKAWRERDAEQLMKAMK